MSITFSCPHCGKELQVPDDAAGSTFACPACDRPITLGAPATPAPADMPLPPAARGPAQVTFRFAGTGGPLLVLGLKAAGLCFAALIPMTVMIALGMQSEMSEPSIPGPSTPLMVACSLIVIAAFVYIPLWYTVRFYTYIASKTLLKGAARGDLQFEFHGSILGVLGLMLHALLIYPTLGIYLPWYIARAMRFCADNVTATSGDGTTYRVRYSGTGGELFGPVLGGLILMVFTFYLYTPYFVFGLFGAIVGKTELLENDSPIGNFSSEGTGGGYFPTFLKDFLLCMVTLGIYGFWAFAHFQQYLAANFHARAGQRSYAVEYSGTGGDYFVLGLKYYFFTIFTFGLYAPWAVVDWIRYECNHTRFIAPG